MGNDSEQIPTTALEDVAYLSRSANRIAILERLTNGSYTRRDLVDETGASRTTLDRIVNELEERGWAERTVDGDYAATARGEFLMRQLRPFLESVEALRRLGDAATWLPTDELTIGLHHFSDAVVRDPTNDDPAETNDYFTELVRDTTEVDVLTHLVPPKTVAEALHDGVVSGRLRSSCVVTDETLAYIRAKPERRERWREMMEANGELYRTEGPLPCNLFVFGETVLIKKSGPGPIDDSYGVPIVTENETVRSWALDLVSRYRAEGTRVDAATFADESRVDRVG